MAVGQMTWLGGKVVDVLEKFGLFARFSGSAIWWFLLGTHRWWRPSLLAQLYQIGTRSGPVIMVVGAFVGMVLAVEAYDQFAAIGQEVRLGAIINISVVKQIGPVLAAVMLAGRVGGAVSAELGTMRVTEQLDALRAMGIDPIAYLVVPRVFACVTMIPLLTIFSNLVGMLGGYLITVCGYGVNAEMYWEFSGRFIGGYDVMTGLIKSLFFGLAIGLISCFKGFYCGKGARGVGEAATEAFVVSFMAIIISNFFLAKLLKDAYQLFVGAGSPSALG